MRYEAIVSAADLRLVCKELLSLMEIVRREGAAEGGAYYFEPTLADAMQDFPRSPSAESAVRLLTESPTLASYFQSCSPGGDVYEFERSSRERGADEHLRFVGEDGFYPLWIVPSGRWIFQRTLVSIDSSLDYSELAASHLAVADQLIVWVPHRENEATPTDEIAAALRQLQSLELRCHGETVTWPRSQGV